MKTADLITSYLNNEMTPEQERQFLLSVAASDSLRLALKSHVMLDRIVTNQIQHSHVPESLRSSIFTQMAASVVTTSPATVNHSASSQPEIVKGARGRFLGGSWFGRGALVALFTMAGFAAGYLAHPDLDRAETTAQQAPAVGVAPATSEAIPQDVALPSAEAQSSAVTGAEIEEPQVASTINTERRPSEPVRGARTFRADQQAGDRLATKGSAAAKTVVPQVTATDLSNPLDHPNARRPQTMPSPSSGKKLDSLRAPKQPASVDVRATITKSNEKPNE